MFTIHEALTVVFWPALLLVGFIVLTTVVLWWFRRPDIELPKYLRRSSIFDVKSELQLFSILLELYKDKYYVFPQLNYSHIVEVNKKLEYRERMGYRNSVDRKSADFVLCDKLEAKPLVVIELDGSSHSLEMREERDNFINELMKNTGLPICHLNPLNLDKEKVQFVIDAALLQYGQGKSETPH